jgi:transcriptional regulator with XRE-family HTH domain
MQNEQRRQFDKRWFLARLDERKLSQRQLAARMGVDPAGISLLLNGKRAVQLEEAQKLATVLGLSLPQVLIRAGVDIDTEHRRVKIMGYINGDGVVQSVAPGSEDEIDGPRDLPADAYALQARTHDSKFAALDRWTVFVSGLQQEPRDLVGQFVLVALKDGRRCISHMRTGYKEGTVNLHLGVATQQNMSALWAMRVLWMKQFEINHN